MKPEIPKGKMCVTPVLQVASRRILEGINL
jgi:hypothetical protein